MKPIFTQFRNPGLVPWVFIIICTITLTSLGVWQMKRLVWKENMLEALETGQREAPLTSLAQHSGEDILYRRVAFIGQLNRSVYFLRIGVHRDYGNGYYVLSPFLLPSPGGSPLMLMANRGFIKGNKQEVEAALASEKASNPTMLKGIMRPAYRPRFFSSNNDPAQNLWVSEDLHAMEQAVESTLSPMVIEVTEEQPVEHAPVTHANKGEIRLRNDHLGYAVTWFGLALTGVIMFGFYARKKN